MITWPEHFSEKEFACPCCGKCEMTQAFLDQLESARVIAGVPFIISSGYRCKKHNATLPNSVPDSAHCKGQAADIVTPNSYIRYKVIFGVIKARFYRIGIGKNFIHVDNDWTKPQKVIWEY